MALRQIKTRSESGSYLIPIIPHKRLGIRVLVACEFSGVVREAFRRRGHDAWSCDFLPAEDYSPYHYQGDVHDLLRGACSCACNLARYSDHSSHDGQTLGPWNKWDLLIAHPPCTYLACSGARWFSKRIPEQKSAINFVRTLANSPVPHIAIENPIGVLSTQWRKPEQIIQPWMFGHGETKATCLWLKGLPKLTPTQIVEGRTPRVHYASPSPDRWKERSRTLAGIADAMAEQWGVL